MATAGSQSSKRQRVHGQPSMNGMNAGMPLGMNGMTPMMMNGQQQELQSHNEEVASERPDGNSETSDDENPETSEFRRLQATVAQSARKMMMH